MAALLECSCEAFDHAQQAQAVGHGSSCLHPLGMTHVNGCPVASRWSVLYAYPESDGMFCREDDAAAALTSGTAFKRKVQAMCGRTLPAAVPTQEPAAQLPPGCPPGRQGMPSVGAVAARPIGDFLNKIGEGIFVGTFRGEMLCLLLTTADSGRDIIGIFRSHATTYLASACCAAYSFATQGCVSRHPNYLGTLQIPS
jgi:hypothetical protein